jgi:hypothetical protein
VKKKFDIPKGSFKKYNYLLISKFSAISREARLISKRFTEIKIEKELLKTKKDFLTEMLYNRKTALTWDFTYCKKVRPEVALLQKIKIIPHKT